MRGSLAAAAALTLGLAWTGAAQANVTILGGGMAAACSKSAKAVSLDRPPLAEALHVCTLALTQELLDTHDMAGTYVNRGVIYLSQGKFADAQRDFDAAARIEPGLGEAYVNRGAALIAQGMDAAGIADIDKGLALETEEPEKAYYNRAIAKERLNDIKGAYFDYRKALELKPDWSLPQVELARFTVSEQ